MSLLDKLNSQLWASLHARDPIGTALRAAVADRAASVAAKEKEENNSMTQEKLAERHAKNLARVNERLNSSRLWHVLPPGTTDPAEAVGLFDVQTRRELPPAKALQAFLDKNPFVYLRKQQSKRNRAILQSKGQLLWSNEGSEKGYTFADAKKVVAEFRWDGFNNWRLPTKVMLERFAKDDANPCRIGGTYRLERANGNSGRFWLTDGGGVDVDDGDWTPNPDQDGYVFACNTFLANASYEVVLTSLINWDEYLVALDGQTFPPERANLREQSDVDSWFFDGAKEKKTLRSADQNSVEIILGDYWPTMQMIELDFTPCRLPKLDATQLSDPEKGLWELWGDDPETLKSFNCVARDPERDVQRRAVAIDFGTSSTVVAMDTPNGARELRRIGVRDFYEPARARHFAPPTGLECADYPAFFTAWTANAYRPALNWDWMRAAHEAQARFRDNPGDTKILSSILPRLKQWALRSAESRRVRLTDQHEHEMELAPLSERNPVRGQPLAVSEGEPFDPVELYAWYLGMAINWRGRGLFLKYYLSFPVKYPREVRERVLASFRRGLQRSLPETLIRHHPQVLNEFEVTELASEPAAYAAAALPHLGVQPTEVGVPYAVFDFGGGTSDFDYGLLRWATPEEEAHGYERVYEHLASDGDNFLGGENLLEHLVYESFKHNLDELRKKRVQFTQPIDALPFAGSEAFLAPTQAAQTNAVMLAAKLRDFMEKDKPELTSPIKLELIDANGNKQTCELVLDVKSLDSILASRMRRGVEAFLAGLARVHPVLPSGATIQILLAGNGSRSRHIKALFDPQSPMWQELLSQAFGNGQENWSGEVPEIVVHPPLPMDDTKPHAPTSKTGVALGLLRLVPGEGTLMTSHLHAANDGQAPFAWFVGRLRRGRFDPIILPNMPYGVWRELGALQQGVFNMYASLSPRAHNGLAEGDPELRKNRLDFPAAPTGSRVYARAVKPHLLELAAAPDEASLEGVAVMTFPLE